MPTHTVNTLIIAVLESVQQSVSLCWKLTVRSAVTVTL